MSVSRSGYYKWKYRKINPSVKELSRQEDIKLIKEIHAKHKSHGYRWINAFIKKMKIDCSEEDENSLTSKNLIDELKINFIKENIDKINLSDLENLI